VILIQSMIQTDILLVIIAEVKKKEEEMLKKKLSFRGRI
jgi:hypothetical protein